MNENENMTAEEKVEATEAVTEAPETATEEKETKGSERRRAKKAEAEIAELTERLAAADAALAEEKEKYLRMAWVH